VPYLKQCLVIGDSGRYVRILGAAAGPLRMEAIVRYFPDFLGALLLLGSLAFAVLFFRGSRERIRGVIKYLCWFGAIAIVIIVVVGFIEGDAAEPSFWGTVGLLGCLYLFIYLYIPSALERRAASEWTLWWKRWRIDSLDRWGRQLAWMLVWSAAFAGLALWMILYKHQWVMPLLPALMSVHFAINAIRIVMYGIRGGGSPLPGRDA